MPTPFLPPPQDAARPADRPCFALLDDHAATPAQPTSRLYTGHLRTLACTAADELPALFAGLERALEEGLHAVGCFSYELGAALHGVASRADKPAPLAQVLLFSRCDHLSAAGAARWLTARLGAAQPAMGDRTEAAELAGIANLHPSLDESRFHADIARVQALIAAGDVYQINHTLRLRFDAWGEPLALYCRLRERQPVPYGAFIALPDGGAVLSLSPELLVRHTAGRLLARPMKGTAAASGDDAADAAAAVSLAADPKNRAENVMITDLLRNDLGRVARTGSVRVPELFGVQRHGRVLQMTSTVEAQRRADASLLDVFTALFPCGSITGAPKRRAMQVIRELEPDARGLYTGAIGWFDAPSRGQAVGDFCLAVPIRTLVLQPVSADGLRAGELGVGAGIVQDSIAADEFAECTLKAAFLTGLPAGFELFETLRASREEGPAHIDLHLERLGASAAYFGFAFDERRLRQEADRACASMARGQPCRLRLALRASGDIGVQTAPLQPIAGPVKLLLAASPPDAGGLFLRHKTTVRAGYDAAWRAAEAAGGFDMLFFNARGELTEGGRSNVFVKLDGRWCTPPLSAGLLPGVMRRVLLGDEGMDACERSIGRDDLRRAEAVMVCNALRGALPAFIDWPA